MSLTKIQALEKTAALWTEVAERTEQRQEVVEPGEILLEMGEEVVNECFLCHYVIEKNGSNIVFDDTECSRLCPVKSWSEKPRSYVRRCDDAGTYYYGWVRAKNNGNWKEAAVCAKKVAYLVYNEALKEGAAQTERGRRVASVIVSIFCAVCTAAVMTGLVRLALFLL